MWNSSTLISPVIAWYFNNINDLNIKTMKIRKSSLLAYLLIMSILMLGLLTSCKTTHNSNKCSAYSNTYVKPSKQSAMKCPGW